MKLDLKTIVLILMGVTGFCIWSAMAYYDPTLRSDYLKFIILIVGGVTGLVLRDLPPPNQELPK